MNPTPGDFSWMKLLLASTTVLGLMAGLGFVMKYIGTRGFPLPGLRQTARRLQLVETLALDTRRRLVIARCDGREHLLLLGADHDIVIETNLPPPSPAPAPLHEPAA